MERDIAHIFNWESFIALALDDRNRLFTTPQILCTLATHELLPVKGVDAALTYDIDTKGWDAQYVSHLRNQYLPASATDE